MSNESPLVAAWQEAKKASTLAQAREMELRLQVAALFPTPKRGTNTLILEDGTKVKYVYGHNIKLLKPDTNFDLVYRLMRDGHLPENLVSEKTEYTVSESAYEGLDEKAKAYVADYFEVKPKSPNIMVE
jgi:hypothetical protein